MMDLCSLRTVVLLSLLLIGGSFALVYRFSAKITTGEGIADVGTPPSDTTSSTIKREPRVVRIQDSDRVFFDAPIPPENPLYLSLNQEYPGIERLQISDGPPIYLVHDFLSDHESDFLINVAESCLSRSLVGGDVEAAGRTSESCYFEQYHLPGLMQKVASLTGKPLEHCEYPQVAKYVAGQQYGQHYDGFSSHGGPTFRRELTYGGNRVATVLIYLNNVAEGGETHFPRMDLKIRPTKGTALVFFPSTANGEFDVQTLHAALPAVDTKYVSQIWVREHGNPRKPPKHLSQKGCRLVFLTALGKSLFVTVLQYALTSSCIN
jgi:prolyl 4-hydroxylase